MRVAPSVLLSFFIFFVVGDIARTCINLQLRCVRAATSNVFHVRTYVLFYWTPSFPHRLKLSRLAVWCDCTQNCEIIEIFMERQYSKFSDFFGLNVFYTFSIKHLVAWMPTFCYGRKTHIYVEYGFFKLKQKSRTNYE